MAAHPLHRLDLAMLPTPLVPLDRISRELGGARIWLKRDDQTGGVLSGNKIRKLEFALGDAIASGCDTVITCGGVQSNHCRATAVACAQLGLECHLILRGDATTPADGNLFLDRLCGAHVDTVDATTYRNSLKDLLSNKASQLEARGRLPYIVPMGASYDVGLWGYVEACKELKAQFQALDLKADAIVLATGSGGTQAGLIAGADLHDLSCRIVGFSVGGAADVFEGQMRKQMMYWAQKFDQTFDHRKATIDISDKYVGDGYGIAGPEIFELIEWVAREEGIVFDPVYTAKAFHALIQEQKAGSLADLDNIVFLHTGGVFGLMARRSEVSSAMRC